MRRKKNHPIEPENDPVDVNAESSIEHLKYIKKLDIQRSILNKIINSDLNQIATNTPIDPDSPDSN
jgi:hypothetical protein